ncbi:MAG: hypothetical protein ACOH18_03025 [Candidatus Saccharimonadaceae bacterium]
MFSIDACLYLYGRFRLVKDTEESIDCVKAAIEFEMHKLLEQENHFSSGYLKTTVRLSDEGHNRTSITVLGYVACSAEQAKDVEIKLLEALVRIQLAFKRAHDPAVHERPIIYV